MSQDSGVTAAFFAAVAKIQKGFTFADIATLRRMKMKNRSIARLSRGVGEPIKPFRKLHSLAPVVRVNMESAIPQYSTLPFFYSFKVTSSPFLPFIESCELPLQNFTQLTGTLVELEKCLEQIAVPFPVALESNQVENILSSEKDLWSIRSLVLHEAYVMGAKEMSAYLNLFYPPTNIDEQHATQTYFAGLRKSIDIKKNEDSIIRMIPVCDKQKCHQLRLYRFGFTKSQLSS